DGVPTGALISADVQDGDRLVVEFGSTHKTTNATVTYMFAGTAGSKDMPNEGTSGLDPDTNTPNFSPWVKFSKGLQFDNCATHYSDETIHDWKRVTVPTYVRTWAPPNAASVDVSARSYVRIVGGDCNVDGLDQVVMGE